MHVNPRKGRKRSRRGVARRRSSGSRMGSGIIGGVKHAFSKDVVKLGAGVVLGSVVTKLTLSYFTAPGKNADGTAQKDANGNAVMVSTLPLGSDPMGPLLYLTLIPVIGGAIIRKWSPSIGQGMMIGGIVNALNLTVTPMIDQEVSKIQAKVSGGSAFLRPARAYLPGSGSNRTMGAGNFAGQRPLFANNAWARR